MIQRCLAVVVSLFVGLTILPLQTAMAQGAASVFAVPQVPVYAEAETAAAAQRNAQETGRRRAMDILLRRLTAEEDWGYLPNLARGQAASAVGPMAEFMPGMEIVAKQPVAIDVSQLPQLEEGFAIFDEKTSGTTYRAKISYRFKPDGVRRLLEAAHLPYSEAQAREALVVPVLETDNGVYLWETNNPWARAWLARPLGNELTPLTLPNGDQQDVEAMTAGQAKALNSQAFTNIAARYGSQQIVLAHGRLREANGEFRLQVRLIDAYMPGRGAAARAVDAANAASLYDDEDGFGTQRVSLAAVPKRGSVLAEAYFRGPGDDFPALAQRAVEGTVAKYARGWKAQTLVDHSAVRPMTLTAWFGSLDEWAVIRMALEKSSLVRSMDVGAFNNENALIDLQLIGEEDQFTLAMRQNNLTVWRGPDGGWNVAGFERADAVRTKLATIALEAEQEDELGFLNRTVRRRGAPLGSDGDVPVLPDAIFGDQPVALDQLGEDGDTEEGDEGDGQ